MTHPRELMHKIVDDFFDNENGRYNGYDLDLVLEHPTCTTVGIGNAVDLEVVELVHDWNGEPIAHGITRPNAVFINGQRVLGSAQHPFKIEGLTPDMKNVVTVTMTLFVRDLKMHQRASHDAARTVNEIINKNGESE